MNLKAPLRIERAAAGGRALLTGGTGFIGSHLVKALRATGWEVHLLIRSPPQTRLEGVRLHVYRGEMSEVMEAMEASRPDVVFHLASLFLAQHTPEQVTSLIQANVLLGTQVLEAMRAAGVRAFLNTGTCWQYFERDTFCPVNLYAATKQAFEDVLAFYVETAGIHAITLSLSDTYGREDTRKKLLRVLLDCLETDGQLEMSPGEQVLDLVHVQDLCAAFLRAAELVRDPNHPAMTTYAVNGGERRTLREIVAVLERAAGRQLQIAWGARPYREREVMQPWIGPGLPGWTATTGLFEGFQDLLEAAIAPETRDRAYAFALTRTVDRLAQVKVDKVREWERAKWHGRAIDWTQLRTQVWVRSQMMAPVPPRRLT